MPIEKAYAYLIHPGKVTAAVAPISSKELVIGSDRLSGMLSEIFNTDPTARDFEITFNAAADGTQHNACRELMVIFQSAPTVENGLSLAERLQKVTDNRSGIGLLFLLTGMHGIKHRLVVSRFPTDQAVLAEVAAGGLDVEFLEQVFIKRLSAYKALMLEHATPPSGFWSGMATDRQAGQSGEHISEYWLLDFLEADFSETPAQGTRRLATVLKQVVKSTPNLKIKGEIASASSLAAAAFAGKAVSIGEFCQHFGFGKATLETVKNHLPKESLFGKHSSLMKMNSNSLLHIAPLN